jgi:hypothetical protein
MSSGRKAQQGQDGVSEGGGEGIPPSIKIPAGVNVKENE